MDTQWPNLSSCLSATDNRRICFWLRDYKSERRRRKHTYRPGKIDVEKRWRDGATLPQSRADLQWCRTPAVRQLYLSLHAFVERAL